MSEIGHGCQGSLAMTSGTFDIDSLCSEDVVRASYKDSVDHVHTTNGNCPSTRPAETRCWVFHLPSESPKSTAYANRSRRSAHTQIDFALKLILVRRLTPIATLCRLGYFGLSGFVLFSRAVTQVRSPRIDPAGLATKSGSSWLQSLQRLRLG